MNRWPIHDAKNRLSELLEQAQVSGPQLITRHGSGRGVVLSIARYEELVGPTRDPIAHLLGGPKFDDFNLPRDADSGRDVEL